MGFISSFLQCGAFIVIPLATFGVGIWKIAHFNEKYHRIGIAGLIGLVFFEGSIIGMLIDPRSVNQTWLNSILISLAIGFVVSLMVLVFLPIAMSILGRFKK